ncbi:Hypothetical Protein FCC1311_022172 [Hondaea fermentalgiana]|uniref:TFIIS central domain-containing protein n=1 Tax=Hondaea fermentalgiana TaxID=2315210 RepID=A0A2R5G4P2_9STRA|nr:Hypothetical Protein FCC1311_022172 [Hondaea fermentalgiana]|eukprot:GBG25997.1 Hypothetical Protein FCC1311_022172 [Hondaea fermentalgiana]
MADEEEMDFQPIDEEELQLLEAVEADDDVFRLTFDDVNLDHSDPNRLHHSAFDNAQPLGFSGVLSDVDGEESKHADESEPIASDSALQNRDYNAKDAELEPVTAIDVGVDDARVNTTSRIPDSGREALRKADVSAEDSVSKLDTLNKASAFLEESIKQLQEAGSEEDKATLAETEAYADGVLRWRLRGAGLTENAMAKGGVPAQDAASLVQMFLQDERANKFPLSFVPEMDRLRTQVSAYQDWIHKYAYFLPFMRSGRSGRRSKSTMRLPASKRMAWKSFQTMREAPKSDFPLLESDHLQNLRSLELLTKGLPEALLDVVERSGGAGPSRPSSRVLEQHYQEVEEKCIAIDDIPVLLPGAMDLFHLRDMRLWRQQARRLLLHANSRVPISSLDEGADEDAVIAKLAWTDPSDLTYEDLQELRNSGMECGVPGLEIASEPQSDDSKTASATKSECKEERLLAARIRLLLQNADAARARFKNVFARATTSFASQPTVSKEPMDQTAETVISSLESLLTSQSETPSQEQQPGGPPHERTDDANDVWIPEVGQAQALLGFCKWHKASHTVLEAIQPVLHECLQESARQSTPRREVGEALEQLDTVLREGREAGIDDANSSAGTSSKEARGNFEHDEDALAAARSCAECIVKEYHEAKALWNRVDTKLASEVERWRRTLVGRVVEVEWEAGDWYLARVAAYKNLDKLHFITYDTGEVEAVLFKWDGEALSMDGEDRIAWREAPADRVFNVSATLEKEFQKRIRNMTRELDRARAKYRKRGQKQAEGQRDLEFDRESDAGSDVRRQNAEEDEDRDDGDRADADGKSFQTLIVGDFIKVEWGAGEYWLGNVRKFEASHGLHCVLYKDGNSEYMQLNEDGSARSKDGSETFSWINTAEAFPIDENDPIPALDDASSAYDSDEDHSDDDDDDDDSDEPGLEDARTKADADYEDPASGKRKRRESASETASQKRARKKAKKKAKKAKKDKKDKRKSKRKHKHKKDKSGDKKPKTKSGGRHIIKRKPSGGGSKGGKVETAADWLALVPRAGDPAAQDDVLVKRRKLARKVIRKIFESGTTGPQVAGVEVLVSLLARDLEKAIFAKCRFFYWDEGASRWRRREGAKIEYGQSVRTICTNLKENKKLLQDVIDREVSPHKLAHMETADLAGDSVKQKIERELREVRESTVLIPTDVAASQVGQQKGDSLSKGPDHLSDEGGNDNSVKGSKTSNDAQGGNGAGSSKTTAIHPIDAKIAESQAKAQKVLGLKGSEEKSPRGSMSRAPSASSEQEAALLPSLRDVLRDANEDIEGDRGGGDRNDEREEKGKESQEAGDKLQRRTWQGKYRHEKVILTLRPASIVYGPGIAVKKRILPSVQLGLVGRQGQTLRLNGHMNPDKALSYLQTVATHAQSSRQFVVAEVQLGASRDDATAARNECLEWIAADKRQRDRRICSITLRKTDRRRHFRISSTSSSTSISISITVIGDDDQLMSWLAEAS